jgi:hypothetical protein
MQTIEKFMVQVIGPNGQNLIGSIFCFWHMQVYKPHFIVSRCIGIFLLTIVLFLCYILCCVILCIFFEHGLFMKLWYKYYHLLYLVVCWIKAKDIRSLEMPCNSSFWCVIRMIFITMLFLTAWVIYMLMNMTWS